LSLPPPWRGIDEGAEADPGQGAGLAGGDVAEQVADHALRQVPGLDAVGHRELLQLRHQAPMAADHAPDQAVVAEVVEAALLAVALAGGVHQGEVTRMAQAVGIGFLRFEKTRFERDGDVFGKADADEAAGGDGVAVADQLHRLAGAHQLAGVAAAQGRDQGMLGHGVLPC
jgi:hypothetical protein